MKSKLREWRVEILMALVLLVGVFLLVEQMQIRQTVRDWLVSALSLVVQAVLWLVARISSSTLSDLTGTLLIIGVLLLARWRLRWRLLRAENLAAASGCPRCGSHLHRIHRKPQDKFIDALVVPVRRYLCSNQACRWSGLRVESRKLRHKQAASSQSAGTEPLP